MKFRLKPGNRLGNVDGGRIGGIGGALIDSMTSLAYLSSLFALLPSAMAVLDEKEVLNHIYAGLNGDNWDDKWNIDSADLCSDESYPGVKCNSNGKITEIHLKENNLAGSLSPHVYTLPHLKHLDLSKNRITSAGFDRIDVVIESNDDLGDIEVIELTNNLVSSVKGVSKLAKSLTGLHMTYNNLKGTIPEELFDLPLLEILAVSENELTGAIDKRLGDLTNLMEFYCYGNKLTGTIPSEIGKLTKMQIITFSENQLSGHLPLEIKNMGNLQTFSVHNNDPDTGNHTGPLPHFDTHPHLNEIYLDGNAFSGTIPHNFLNAFNGSEGETVTIGLENNNITGTVPGEFIRFDSLVLNIVGNRIEGYGPDICDDASNQDKVNGWMNGMVELFGCDAILCPIDTYSDTGRQEETETPCEPCDSGTGGFMGATECDGDVKVVNGTADELEILVEFYLALNGLQWLDVEGWSAFAEMESPADLTLPSYQDEGIDPCEGFSGIACNEDGSIIEVSLPNNGLEGMVPKSFFDLPNLRELDLSGNEIRLDREFGFGDIGKAAKLRKVDLSSNDIQKFSGIGKATSLEELIVNDAYFFSAIDTELYELTGLKVLELKYSGLKGSIPEGISALSILKDLDLYGNELTGRIPAEIGLMTKLWHVDLSENDFTGPLPADAIAKLLDLQKFHVHQSGKIGDGITGKLPSFKEQKLLHMLDLNSNSITGTIPTTFLSGVTDVDQLMAIDIGYNQLDGLVPGTLSRFTNMRLFAMKNKFEKVGPKLCNLTGWLNGEVGKVIEAGGDGCDAILCPKGTFNSYGRATSGGDGACKPCPDAEFAGATGCGNTDEDDDLEKRILDKLFISTGGVNWTKKENWETGPVCTYEGIMCSGNNTNEGVEEINLAGFGLISDIPTEIYTLPNLKKLNISRNVVSLRFDGISKAVNLEEIDMVLADLTSVDGISDAPSLKRLHISHNSFPKGSIPDELYSMVTLELLDIGYNGFTGSLPADIANLVNLKEFYAGGNDITGTIPKEISGLSELTSLALSENRMSGEIPNELEKIAPLRILHLNGQRDFGGFTGRLPTFNTSQHMHEIDFSKNSLTGSIPRSFLAVVRTSDSHDDYAYDRFDLSSNQITGAIPEDWDDFVGLFVNLAGNRITNVSTVLCDDDDEFMDFLVGNLTVNKCDAILCPPGTSSPQGRQVVKEMPCQPCSGESKEERELQAPYYGTFACKSISEEKSILEQLHSLIFVDKSADTNWMTEKPICSWYGITCENDEKANSGVTEINLESNYLKTDDPDEVSALFFALPNLKKLDLKGNDHLALKFDDIWKSTQLESLQISATGITSIAGIGMATKLKELHVTDNGIAGPFPVEIFNLTSMERLYLSFNQISGVLPTRIGELTNLREFYAYTNNMNGTLPTELGKLVEMENLVIGKNDFEGNLPTQLNNLVNLREFSVYQNPKLSGPILDFRKVTKLEKLDLEGNGFTGPIPSSFLSSLSEEFYADSDNEIILHLADNALTGEIPEGVLSKIKNLYLDVTGNQFKMVPPSFCQDEQSLWMNGKVGQLQNDDPCYAIACPVNTYSNTGRKHSADEDEECITCASDQGTPFIGSRACHRMDDEYTALKALYLGTFGDSWKKSENWMDNTKPICSWHGVQCAGDSLDNHTVTGIDLSANSLGGTMPHEIWELPSLQNLNLKENDVFVHFTNIYKATKLELLYISDIDIGSIDGLGKAPALTQLHLTANELTGKIPAEFFELTKLESLYIAYNSFSGTLSTEFGKMTKLVDFYAYDNEFSGPIPAEFASLKNLKNFVVAENKLSGTIPEEFSYMPQLELFSAYRRLKAGPKLSGNLPSFSNVPNLHGLYLDYNHLVGTIPSNFLKSSLQSELITISHNLLTGNVPLELALLDDLNIEMEGNKLDNLDERFCENLSWMNGLVSNYSCDALMCQPGSFSIYGRQNSTDSACEPCDVNADNDPAPFWGSTSCDGLVDDKGFLEKLYSETTGDNWHNNENWLKTDDFCNWYGVECRDGKSVQAIRLGANNLVGTPPKEIFYLKQLHTLWLHSNPILFKFEGIEKAQNLIDLRLDATGLSETFGVGKAKNLIKLDLKYNQISGRFPVELLDLEKLESLSLTDNSLTGGLPTSFESLSNLIELRLGSNRFTGALTSFSGSENLIVLDLSENDLAGPIPNDFLNSLSGRKPILVDLSSNSLSGIVPHHLDRLDQLVIYLRDNKFHTLPGSLCDTNNQAWNMREVEMFGCDAIMCPPRTANFHGRQSAANIPCMKCESNTDLYGQITCNGVVLEASSSSRLAFGLIAAFTTHVLGGLLLIQAYM